jgi:hypothetical protein
MSQVVAYKCPRCSGPVEVRNYRRYQRRVYYVDMGSCEVCGWSGVVQSIWCVLCSSTSYAVHTDAGWQCLRCSGVNVYVPA